MKAIVYTSGTGHTARYAQLLGEQTGLAVYSLADAKKQLPKGTEILYLGWLFVGKVKGYKKANRKYRIKAVCGVGLCDTGTALSDVRKSNKIPEATLLFTMQGGMDKKKLKGLHKSMIHMLIKGMSGKKDKTADDARMLYLLENDRDYVCPENTTAFMEWYNAQ